MSSQEADVLIVGGGPVGLTLAAEMSYRGMSAILIEKRRTTSNSPKALLVNSRSMEHFRRLGVQEKLQSAAYPRDLHPNTFAMTGLCTGNVIGKVEFSSWGEIEDGKEGATSFYFKDGSSPVSPLLCPQFQTEAVLYKHIMDTATNVSLCFGWQVKSFSQDDSGVEIQAVCDDGEERVFKGRYLVGCDGGASFIRKQLGLHMFGKFVLARACTVFFNSPQLVDVLKEKGCPGMGFVVNPEVISFVGLLNMEGDFAVHILKSPNTSDEELDDMVRNPSRVVDAILGCSGFPYNVIEASRYNMHGLVTTRFSVGRCFLAGDSAHQWLPAGGLGLNSGISDVGNLAWKLEALVKGYGGPHLSESYESEQRPLDDSTRRFAMMAGGFLPFIGSRPFVVVTTLLKKSSLLRTLLRPLLKRAILMILSTGLELVSGFQYSNSGIVKHEFDADGSVSLKSHGAKSSLPGCRAPHVVLSDGSSIIDIFGKSFVLLIIGSKLKDYLEDLKQVCRQRNVPFEVHAYASFPQLTEVYDRRFFLVRPDGVIAWRSDYQPSIAESDKIVSTALGHSTPTRLLPLITKYDSAQGASSPSFSRLLIMRCGVMYFLTHFLNVPFLNSLFLSGLGLMLSSTVKVRPPPEYRQKTSRHQAAIIGKYGSAENVLRVEPKYMGSFGPNDVLIQVYSSSVNELDVEMRRGLGSSHYQKVFNFRATGGTYFPLILGRDCSGRVVAVGDNVSKFLTGDSVYAVVPPDQPGTHAQLVAVNEKYVAVKPSNVDHKEASSLPWVAMMAWTAIVKQAGLTALNTRGKKVLVHNGTCGVSSFAIQLLKAWGAHVTVTCFAEDLKLAQCLGADEAISIRTGNFSGVLRGMDFILDPVGGAVEGPSLSVLKWYQQAVYVTTNSPQLHLVNCLGGFFGNLAFSWLYRFKVIFNSLFKGKRFYYVDPTVTGECLDEVRTLIEQGAVKPVVDAVYSLDEVVAAHKHVETGQTRGKVVITMP